MTGREIGGKPVPSRSVTAEYVEVPVEVIFAAEPFPRIGSAEGPAS